MSSASVAPSAEPGASEEVENLVIVGHTIGFFSPVGNLYLGRLSWNQPRLRPHANTLITKMKLALLLAGLGAARAAHAPMARTAVVGSGGGSGERALSGGVRCRIALR